ncbi:MAG: hypothetical protein ACXWP6_16555 [Ktedonobacterales bacterium]
MKITPEMLQALVSINGAAAYLQVDTVRSAKQAWWGSVRQAYNLDPNTKYKVAITGEDAGELRYKHTGQPVEDRPLGRFAVIHADDIVGARHASLEDARANAGERELVVQVVD